VSGRQSGQALVWFVVLLPLVFSVVGLAIDGESVLRAHRRLQGAADGAARTGASQIQVDHARRFPAAPALLDRAAAERAAIAYTNRVYPDVTVAASADDRVLVVQVQRQVTPGFLQLLQVGSIAVSARGQASPRSGIDRPVESR
jgi:Flp pilus assembly protein TadG